MLIFETSGRFPFRTMRLLGWSLITLGVLLLVLDVTDVAYTVQKFEEDCEEEDHGDWKENPCEHNDHIFAYIASGIWTGLVVIITGVIGARFSKWNIRHLRFQRDLYALMSGLCGVLFIPAVITMHALELVKLKDMGGFYYEDDDLKTRDEVKFAVPMVILMIAVLIFCNAVAIVCVCCCCAPVHDYRDEREWHKSYVNPMNQPYGYGDPYYQRPSLAYQQPPYASPYVIPGPRASLMTTPYAGAYFTMPNTRPANSVPAVMAPGARRPTEPRYMTYSA